MSLAVSATIFAGKAAIISAFFELYICILRSLQNIVIFQKNVYHFRLTTHDVAKVHEWKQNVAQIR